MGCNLAEVQAAVGMSRKWDAREAGREVARNTIKQLDAPPDFFLLFSTIHYKDHGGFGEFLSGVWDVLPKGTPLVGGTVVGFMNNFGTYTRGASALAVSSVDRISLKRSYGTSALPARDAYPLSKLSRAIVVNPAPGLIRICFLIPSAFN